MDSNISCVLDAVSMHFIDRFWLRYSALVVSHDVGAMASGDGSPPPSRGRFLILH